MSDDSLDVDKIIASWRVDMVRRERLEQGVMIALSIVAALITGIVIGGLVW